MTVLIIGASGYVGKQLWAMFFEKAEVIGTYLKSPITFNNSGLSCFLDIRDKKLTDEIRYPIYVEDLCGALFELAYDNSNEKDILHIAGPEAISRYKFACKLAHFLGYDPESIPRGINPDGGENRPLNLSIDISRAKVTFKTKLRSINEVLVRK